MFFGYLLVDVAYRDGRFIPAGEPIQATLIGSSWVVLGGEHAGIVLAESSVYFPFPSLG